MTWELDPDNRPHPSDFSEELREEARCPGCDAPPEHVHAAWCQEQDDEDDGYYYPV